MDLRQALRRYKKKNNRLACASLLGNLAVYAGAVALSVVALDQGRWLAATPAIVALAVAGVRRYVLQHDLGHLSRFETKRLNEIWGDLVSPLTMAACPQMRHNHILRHTCVGDLDARETTEIHTMTLRGWHRAGPWHRLHYRLCRAPPRCISFRAALRAFTRKLWDAARTTPRAAG